jgi:hypothetical protein
MPIRATPCGLHLLQPLSCLVMTQAQGDKLTSGATARPQSRWLNV